MKDEVQRGSLTHLGDGIGHQAKTLNLVLRLVENLEGQWFNVIVVIEAAEGTTGGQRRGRWRDIGGEWD